MKLEKIKLSGFKSFVDPTTIPISSNLTAIVGPNGCGKSNIIDAVRWVMGESSAKHLRGGNMTDVIFNGSSGRKPVSVASVELIFDNGEGKAGGEYAQYATISIKRQVSRDGLSLFMLNGSRCRRKDITDLFLGTGLGSRSYAIIEQGTISRMVEAKPDDLRVHIEEAAGVSKYKERRAETETRMRHTRENLERLNDLRDEVEKQLKNLAKQAEKAEKYSELKKQERRYKQELLAMRWQSFQRNAQQLEDTLQAIAEEHNRLFVLLRDTEKAIELKRGEQKTQQQHLDTTQADYYAIVADVGRLEQAIKHSQKSHEETLLEIKRLKEQAAQSQRECEQDAQQLEEIRQTLLEAEETLIVAREREEELLGIQHDAQSKKQQWQQQWEGFLADNAGYREQVEVQRTTLFQLENQNRQWQARLDKLLAERNELADSALQLHLEDLADDIDTLDGERAQLQAQLDAVLQQISVLRPDIKRLHDQLHDRRAELHQVTGKISSLELLQQHAMGKDKKDLADWLERTGLLQQPRLAEFLEADEGWDVAVETVLGAYLEAVCVDSVDAILNELSTLEKQSLIVIETRRQDAGAQPLNARVTLLDKVRSRWQLDSLLSGVYCADSLPQARSMVLADHESVIVPDSTWLGRDWVRVSRGSDSKAGVLHREKALRELKLRQAELHDGISDDEQRLETYESALKTAEHQREDLQRNEKHLAADYSAKNAQYSAQTARHEQQCRRLAQLDHDVDEIRQQLAENAGHRSEAEMIKHDAEASLDDLTERKTQLEAMNRQLQAEQQTTEVFVDEARRHLNRLQAQIESLKSSEVLTVKQIERLHVQRRQAIDRVEELENKLQYTLSPLDEEKMQLEALLATKQQFETALQAERQSQQAREGSISELAEQYSSTQRALEQQKDALDTVRFEQQDSRVRQQTLAEQLAEIDADPEVVLNALSADASEHHWKQMVDDLAGQIERLGAINLTAIEDYRAQSERMAFLDEQHDDLVDALNSLDQAIAKIDRESRQRFKETFDRINNGLKDKFPKLFGGGQAYLELTEQGELDAGVNIIARPPGKRNSSIHLLSGGEKALTAVALVFSIFELNPAPFCLLDEVDAPLDDANVVRFSRMVEEMSSTVQFLYISHNKVTMEIAKHLAGVTMKEPGVSRMVAVDIEEAVSMAES
ncbi:MAG: chromosome segregation protein SMC [Methylomonas sp.]|nr:chromosome segregation protein SMC [Methylomonas sp.]PPD21034.1 MAG: chromosome segregation protein SMC [Methylomonas sp.]PPD27061.1 MAG: chromosome segregation protein SMC [Methylomonas sp.]PPD38994.1 MAG: chromosome segregation protein SMC [Methylomonas sp.]PPD40886.1 MAG: chromosome segregation protein SMC [Methylomonas sp.]